jgi:predicted porin
MKIRNKIIALMISLIAIPTFALAKDAPYVGIKGATIHVDYKTVEGIDLNDIYADEYNAIDLHAGYNIGNSFIELGYIKSNKESKNLGTFVVAGITLVGSTSVEFEGWRIGVGHNFKYDDKLSFRPFLNYYELDVDSVISATSTSGTFKASASTGGNDNMIDVGLGIDYKLSDRSKLIVGYSQSIDDLTNTDSTKIYSVSFTHSF